MVCKICGGACENTVYLLKNVRKDLQETFEYVKCSECGCLQIREIPENLGDYYDNAIYYSFKSINMGGGDPQGSLSQNTRRHKKCCSWHAIIPDISLEMVKRNKTQIQENWRTTKRDENCRYRLWQW